MSTVRYRLYHHPAETPVAGRAPLLFVHGAYTHAGFWQYRLIPWLQARGWTCWSLDLSGHGQATGRETLDQFGLDDYVQDLTAAVAEIGQPPVLVAHSMGTMVVQRYLTRGTAAGMALLAPVPPNGTGASAGWLALVEPDFFTELPRVVSGHITPRGLEMMARIYFSPRVGTAGAVEWLTPLASLFQPESQRAITELLLPFLPMGWFRPRVPTLVMGGSADAIFSASLLFLTALPWQGSIRIVEGAGHMLVLDPQWETAGQTLVTWLETLS